MTSTVSRKLTIIQTFSFFILLMQKGGKMETGIRLPKRGILFSRAETKLVEKVCLTLIYALRDFHNVGSPEWGSLMLPLKSMNLYPKLGLEEGSHPLPPRFCIFAMRGRVGGTTALPLRRRSGQYACHGEIRRQVWRPTCYQLALSRKRLYFFCWHAQNLFPCSAVMKQ